MKTQEIQSIVEKHAGRRGALISILEDIQSRYSYLPEHALRAVADQLGRPLADIYGVATFYRGFSLKPRGKHLIFCCQGTACHVRGAPRIAEELEKQLKAKPGETTSDKEFTFEVVNCLGACALGPVVVVDGRYFSGVSTVKVKQIIEQARAGLDKIDVRTDRRIFPLTVSCSRCNHNLMDPEHPMDGFPSIRLAMSLDGEQGWLRLSALYGGDSFDSEHTIPLQALVTLFCPHCHSELAGSNWCPECSAQMITMIVQGGGILQLCPRRGCKGRMLDIC